MINKRFVVTFVVSALALAACRKTVHDHAAGSGSSEDAAAAPAPNIPGQASHEGAHAGHETAASVPSGYAAFEIEPARATSIGLSTSRVEERKFERTIRTTGVVALDETRTSHVHAKVRGWIERVMADFVGKEVKAGTPLCTIYSQDVYAAQLEYLSVLERTTAKTEGSGPFAEAERDASQKLVAAARRRLALWDVPASEIDRLEKTRQPQRTFVLVAPRSGIVVSKLALPGMFIDPGTELYLVSDISRLWILADVYGADVPWVRVGAPATLRIESLEAQRRDAKVAFLPPTIEESTRTLKVRFEVDNEDGRARPGAFATVEMRIDLGASLAIPETAVIHAGNRAIVFVLRGTRVEPRAVELGPMVDGYYRVVSGVHPGEAVAVGAQFLIDSESRLRATSGPGAQHGGH